MESQNDPRSWDYIRKYNRPRINYWMLCVVILVLVMIGVGIYVFVAKSYNDKAAAFSVIAYTVLVLGILLKRIVVLLVKLYQRFAPISVRQNCRFEPSCSQYMIDAINKYGLAKGFSKGLNRIRRCSTGDGGFEEA